MVRMLSDSSWNEVLNTDFTSRELFAIMRDT